MSSRSNPKPRREWDLKDMEHHDAAIREVLIIALDKHESSDGPVILTTDSINAEVIRRRLREPAALEGKKKGALIGSYGKRESMNNLSPPLFIQIGRGRYRFNLYYLDKLRQFADRWRFGESPAVPSEASRVLRVQEHLESLHREVDRLSTKLDTVAEQVRSLLAEEIQALSFVHTSPDFPDTTYGAKVTSIRETIKRMLERATHSIRISTRQIDMFEDELIRLRQTNPDLEITVLSRGPERAEGPRKKIAGRAFDRMREARIKLPIELDLLHSRMVVIDEKELLVSSADLDYTQLEKQFNSGIWTNAPDVVAEAVKYFDNLLKSPTVK
jgi:hypothetical protein